ncbi:MAG TPA: hypothetical protein VGC79_22170, partial [Polyangiaceae bacterium]
GSAFPWAANACACFVTPTLLTWTMTDLSGYQVGGTNTLTWNSDIAEVLNPNATWSGAVMRVTVVRP